MSSTRYKMTHEFPHLHVRNLMGGTIGPVYITVDKYGNNLFADAVLHDAPFKQMVIDSPLLLRMFTKPEDPIDVTAVGHPWPMFRLVEREEMNFDVARLVREEFVRADTKSGFTPKEHQYTTKMKVKPTQATNGNKMPPAPMVADDTLKPRKLPERIKPIVSTPKASTSKASTPKSIRDSPPTVYRHETKLSKELEESILAQMEALKKEIHDILPLDGQSQYQWLLTTGLKRQGKEGAKFRGKIVTIICELMRSLGDQGNELKILHNRYAELQRKLERRWVYHLPIIKNFHTDGAEESQ